MDELLIFVVVDLVVSSWSAEELTYVLRDFIDNLQDGDRHLLRSRVETLWSSFANQSLS